MKKGRFELKLIDYLKKSKEVIYVIALIAIFVISMWGKQNGGIYILLLLVLFLYEKELIGILNRVKRIGNIELSNNINDAIEQAPYDIKNKVRRINSDRLSDENLRMKFIRNFTEFERIVRSKISTNENARFLTLQQIISRLVQTQEIDPYILTSYMDIKYLRNALVHGMYENISRDMILKGSELLDIMIDLLKYSRHQRNSNAE